MRKKIYAAVLILAEAAVLAFLVFGILTFKSEEIPLGFKNWNAQNARWDEGWGWSAEEEADTEAMLESPKLTLPKGTYELIVEYEADSMQHVGIQGRLVPISQNEKSSSIAFESAGEDSALTIQANYNGKGSFSISNLEVRTTSALLRRRLVWVLLFFLLLDCFCYAWITGKDTFPLLSVLGITLLCSIPLLKNGIHSTTDLGFHLIRIEALADGLERGIFPLRLSSVYMNGWGYPNSIFYGDLLLYFGALLRIMGFSAAQAYKGYLAFTNFLMTAAAYKSFRYIFREKKISALLALVYCTCGFHLGISYGRAMAGVYTAMIFFPMIAAGFWDLSGREIPDQVHAITDIFLLSFGFAGIAVSHILSAEIAILAAVITALFLLPRFLRPKGILVLLCGAAGSVLLSLFFVLPFLDYFFNEQVIVRCSSTGGKIQGNGLGLDSLFSFFRLPAESLSPGIVLTAVLFIALWLLLSRKGTKKNLLLTLLSVIFLWISSRYFPWNALLDTPLAFMTSIQFPWRWLGIASVVLTLLAGELLSEFPDFRSGRILVLTGCIFSMLLFFSNYSDSDRTNPYDRAEVTLHSTLLNYEYLRCDFDTRSAPDPDQVVALKAEVTGTDLDWLECLSRDGNTYVLDVMASTEHDGAVDLPLFNYRYMTARDEKGNILPVSDGENFCVHIDVPAGFDGKITVRFEEPLSWRIASVISLVSLLGSLAAYLIFRRKHREKVCGEG